MSTHEPQHRVSVAHRTTFVLFLQLQAVACPVVLACQKPACIDSKTANDARERFETRVTGGVFNNCTQLTLVNVESACSSRKVSTKVTVNESLHAGSKGRRVDVHGALCEQKLNPACVTPVTPWEHTEWWPSPPAMYVSRLSGTLA